MKVVVIDGQSGRMGQLLIDRMRAAGLSCEILAVGTNALATAAMLKAGADAGATGENPVLVACRTADIIAGPIGILSADSLLGEITPAMAVAIGYALQAPAMCSFPSFPWASPQTPSAARAALSPFSSLPSLPPSSARQ